MFSTSLTVRLGYWRKKKFFVSKRVKNHFVQADFALWVECFNFQLTSYYKYKTKHLLSSRTIFLAHVGFFLFWNFDSCTLFLLCHNNVWCHHALLQQYIWHKLCSHHHLGPFLLLQFPRAWPFSACPGYVSCAVAHTVSLHEQSIFNVCKGIDIHIHTMLLVQTVHNHLVEVIFSTLLNSDRSTWTHEVYQYIYFKQQTNKL